MQENIVDILFEMSKYLENNNFGTLRASIMIHGLLYVGSH